MRVERRRFLSSLGSGAVLLALAPGLERIGRSRAVAQERPGADDPGTELLAGATGLDRTHLPLLSLPARPRLGRSFDLVVRVGEPLHEQRRDHHIQWIEVRHAGELLFACDLSPSVPFPVARVPVVLRREGELVVRLRCSQHGVFRFRLPVAPT